MGYDVRGSPACRYTVGYAAGSSAGGSHGTQSSRAYVTWLTWLRGAGPQTSPNMVGGRPAEGERRGAAAEEERSHAVGASSVALRYGGGVVPLGKQNETLTPNRSPCPFWLPPPSPNRSPLDSDKKNAGW